MIHSSCVRGALLTALVTAAFAGGSMPRSIDSSIERAASPQQRTPAQSRELRRVVRELTQEAQEVRKTGLSEDASPDFASRYEGNLAIVTVQHALIMAQHRDPFIDAYIRWQLLSFEPPFPDLDDAAYLRLLSELPALIENPRGERSFLELAARAEKLDVISPGDFEQLQRLDEERRQQMHHAESLNKPATALREWVRAGVENSTVRTIQLMIEECAVLIDGSWQPGAVKANLTRAFTAAADEISIAEKQLLAEQTRGLVGRERRFVNAITFFADRSINVSYSRPNVNQRDYDRWMHRLAGGE